ncbi:MAG: hypothetical protein ACLQEQ_01030 [Nitrososphaerales archaeon]
MVSIPTQFTQLLNGLPAWPLFIVLLIVSLLLIFAGRKVVKVLAFLIVGLIGATMGGALGAQYLSSLGWLGSLLGLLIGFVAGGLIGLLMVRVGIGIAVGYAAYLLTLDVVSNTTAALVVGFIFFVVGVVLYNKILTVVTAFAGGFLLYDALTFYIDPTVAAVIAVLVAAVGLWYDFRHGRRGPRSTPWNATPTI